VTTILRFAFLVIVLALAACTTRSVAPVEDRGGPPPRGQPRVSPPPIAAAPGAPSTGDASSQIAAEPDWRPQSYTVKRGDTLHAIALEHGLDYRELAAWNGIDNPNLIRVGQVLRLAPGDAAPAVAADTPGGVVTAPLRAPPPVVETKPASAGSPAPSPSVARNTESMKVSPKAVKERYSPELAREMARAPAEPAQIARVDPAKPAVPPSSATTLPPPSPTPAPVPAPSPAAPPASSPPVVANVAPSTPRAPSEDGDDLDWAWPAKGKLVTGFSDTANLKGIDIAGSAGQPVLASAPGRVVYAGTGLRGYGKLVIIKHNNTFLSAYAHNKDITVKEGQQVKRGEKIAEMGSTDADQVKLHFEIRRLGKPMDPLKYLPPG